MNNSPNGIASTSSRQADHTSPGQPLELDFSGFVFHPSMPANAQPLTEDELTEFNTLLRARNPRCEFCGTTLNANQGGLRQLDPNSRNGTAGPFGLVLACDDCQIGKEPDSPKPQLSPERQRTIDYFTDRRRTGRTLKTLPPWQLKMFAKWGYQPAIDLLAEKRAKAEKRKVMQ